MNDEEISTPTSAQVEALSRLLTAATDLANAKLSSELTGTEFQAALRAGAASIELVVKLPSGQVEARAIYPAMSPAPLELFEVKALRQG